MTLDGSLEGGNWTQMIRLFLC
uniref:Uncharacterized protein n=1 Tax=Triticum urartu TaxID=4572 RepID=A0A8R7QPU9_TRIUA